MSTRATHHADVHIVGRGTVFLFRLLSSVAREWVDEHVGGDLTMLGDGLAVEHRYAHAIATGMQQDGLLLTTGEVR